MNYPFYFKKIKYALTDYQDNKLELSLREMRHDILTSEDKEDRDLIPILDFIIEFLNPIQRILCVVVERQKEENLIKNTKWDTLDTKYQLLTIRQLFDCMIKDISPSLVQYTIDRLPCGIVTKSDLKDSVINKNFDIFNSTIRDNNIDYTFASNVCSHIIYLSKSRKELVENITEICDEEDDEELDGDDFILRVCACYDMQLETILNNFREEGCSEEEVEEARSNLSELYDTIKELYRNGDIKNAMLIESITNFAYFCWPLHRMALDGELLPIEKQILSDFVAKQTAAIPFVKGFLSLFTKGKIFLPDFDYVPENVDDEEVYKLVDSCSVEPLCIENHETSNTENNTHEVIQKNVLPNHESANDKEFSDDKNSLNIDDSITSVFEKYPLLSSERARKYLKIAIEKDYITIVSETKWEWSKRNKITKVGLAYLLARIYFYDYVRVTVVDRVRKDDWIHTSPEDLAEKDVPYTHKDINDQIEKLFGNDIMHERSRRNCGTYSNHAAIDQLVSL